ncbi:MAG: hypothetical protein JWO36_3309 [Myxococcales bacterium]|nr:hypothetical protein [Myxococcales bacterium]
MRSGLDGVLAELEQAFAPLDISDLPEDPNLRSTLAGMLDDKLKFDEGGPRNTRLQQLSDSLVATLSLTLFDEPDRTVTFADEVRVAVAAALAGVVDIGLAVPQIRETIIAKARELIDPRHAAAFGKIAAQLDERAMRIVRQPKVPLEADQAIQKVLTTVRHEVVEQVARAAIDAAQQVLARADADAAARIDRPITLRMTPRDVAIRRVNEARVPKTPAAVAHSLLDSLTELARLAWRPVEQPVRVYGASQTFAVGDVVEHPKFGRGSVISSALQRIEVEFADGRHTLAHVGRK